jgi:hypothetical protein
MNKPNRNSFDKLSTSISASGTAGEAYKRLGQKFAAAGPLAEDLDLLIGKSAVKVSRV